MGASAVENSGHVPSRGISITSAAAVVVGGGKEMDFYVRASFPVTQPGEPAVLFRQVRVAK